MDEVATEEAPAPHRGPWLEVGMYCAVALVCFVVAFGVLGFWHTSFSIPLTYSEDALALQSSVKGMIDNGWITHNAYLGAPGQQSLTPFPTTEMLQFLVIKLMTLVSHDVGLVVNLYYLLTYSLVALAALAVFRAFGIRRPAAVAGAIVYTFLPFHQLRGELHLTFSAYYLVPLAIMVVLWTWSDRQPVFADVGDGEPHWRFTLADKRTIAALVICLLVGLGGAYYALFALFFIAGSAVIVALSALEWRRLVGPAILAGVLIIGLAVALSPYLLAHDHGQAANIAQRSPGETTIYGLKVADLLLPMPGHRIAALASIRARFQGELSRVAEFLNNESQTAALGVIGSVGLLFLLLWLPIAALGGRWTSKVRAARRYTELSTLTWFGILLGTVGGLGTIIAVFLSAQIRAYNRISVFIGFFAIFAVCLLLDAWFDRMGRYRSLPWLLAIAIIVVGVYDQTTPRDYVAGAQSVPRAVNVAEFNDDAAFVARVEAALPRGAAVYQLPYVAFPENGDLVNMGDYEHFRGYLHSKLLRFSYGAVKGSQSAQWAQATARLPIKDMAAQLKSQGFGAIWLDLRGYDTASGQAIAAALTQTLGNPIAVDAPGTRVVWRL